MAEDNSSDNAVIDSVDINMPTISRNDMFSEQEIAKMDKNYKVLINYIKISDDSTSYFLDLSEEEALKLNVDKEYYQSTVESIKQANIALKEGIERGDNVELSDFQSMKEVLNNSDK
ncbi:hypothetical protein [uncultured Duncaniella sp.]|uniref:hypothetical protein n=2 Tax=uncultured Duncaniella sp. TaxID=2768039 RepID=UPI00267563A2|nr:hypothetical protein [uncultured Duncaniella sp.]